MSEFKEKTWEKEIQHIKIPLCGTLYTCSNKELVIHDGKCFESFGTITFKNKGYCEVEIFKNNLIKPVAVVIPGASFTLTSNPFYRIVVKCKDLCNNNTYKKCHKYVQFRKYTEKYSYSKCEEDYEWGMCEHYTSCKDRHNCHKCVLCYKGFVYTELKGLCCNDSSCSIADFWNE